MGGLTANDNGNNATEKMLGQCERPQSREMNSPNDCDHQMEQDDSELVQQWSADDADIHNYVYDSEMKENRATHQEPSVANGQASSASDAPNPSTLLLNPSAYYSREPYSSYRPTSSPSLPPNEIAFPTSFCGHQHGHQSEHQQEAPSFLSQLQHLLQLSCLQHHYIQTLLLHLACQYPVLAPLKLPSDHGGDTLLQDSISEKLTGLREMVDSMDEELYALKVKSASLQEKLNEYKQRRGRDGDPKQGRENEKQRMGHCHEQG